MRAFDMERYTHTFIRTSNGEENPGRSIEKRDNLCVLTFVFVPRLDQNSPLPVFPSTAVDLDFFTLF